MAVASVSVIFTVVVLKLHHCSPNQKRIPHWARQYILGTLAKIVRCHCITEPCFNLGKKKRKEREKQIGELEPHEVHTRLLKEMESITNKNGSNIVTLDTSSRHNSAVKTSLVNDINNSRLNLDFRDFTVSNRSSIADEELNPVSRRDKSNATMEEILKYLKLMVVKSDEQDAEDEIVDEWKQIALVIDRLFFWTFLFITILSSIVILVVVPSFKHYEEDGL